MLAPRLPCSLFVLDGTGSLKLTDSPLISLSTGTATFSELTVTNLNFSDEAAIKSTNTLSLTVSQSSFENITRKAESGLALSAVVQSSPSVSVTLSNFTACHSLDEDFSLETEASDTNYMATGRGATKMWHRSACINTGHSLDFIQRLLLSHWEGSMTSVLATIFSDCSMKGQLTGTYAGGLYSISTRLTLDDCLF
ncbi:hypothetical protein BLNAU_10780 [Blattamonas nauphoetae]|uniref:Uncharacterized protein n=1 Tax=Blattamonas nauphoetae TaxID=2049346 RepID=A0ABQ9XSX7_9EUKA|nr:hypothetical protein BLNAU_10780 [Blattamonas nauphoetae]